MRVPPVCRTDAATIPYVVMPNAGPAKVNDQPFDAKEFHEKTNLAVGDYGVVIANGKVVSVVIADAGAFNKIGEASTALLMRLSPDGKPTPIDGGAITILFPGTRSLFPRNADTFAGLMCKAAAGLYAKLIGSTTGPQPVCAP